MNKVSDSQVVNILRFLLENTVFQNVLQDLHVNVLYIEEGNGKEHTISTIKPKCLFVAHSLEEGQQLFERVQPQIVIIYAASSMNKEFIRGMVSSHASVVVIWDQEINYTLVDLIVMGIRNIVLAPITPQAILAEVQKSLYELSLVKQVMLQQELLQMMFDFQSDLLFIVEDTEIIDCNTNFLRFFGYEDLLSYHNNHISFTEHLAQESGYYVPTHNMMWLDECLAQPRKIKMHDVDGNAYVFLLRAESLPEDVSRCIVTCTDISQVDEEYNEQERLMTIDSLTDIYNRMKFQKVYVNISEKENLANRPLSIILFDIDNFKEINNTYGHNFGDLALVQLADLVKVKLSSHHIFARWDGGQFIILLMKVTEKQAFQIAESLRFFIETKKFSGISRLTASFGVAMHEEGITKEMLLERANIALQEAKKNGKNQVFLYREGKK